jgi:hypothetical protein
MLGVGPLLALSGHARAAGQSPLSGEEQTSQLKGSKSASDPKRTSGIAQAYTPIDGVDRA